MLAMGDRKLKGRVPPLRRNHLILGGNARFIPQRSG